MKENGTITNRLLTREQAQTEFMQLMHAQIDEADRIMQEAKSNGTWLPGLDSNNALFTELHNQTWKKIEELKRSVIQQYDRVLLKDGHEASIVEIFSDVDFLADIDKCGDTYTEDVKFDEIARIIRKVSDTVANGNTTVVKQVKYIGKTEPVALTHDKVYDVISIERTWYRIVDDSGEDYLYPPESFEIVENNPFDDNTYTTL